VRHDRIESRKQLAAHRREALMEVSMRDHLLKTTEVRELGGQNERFIVRQFIKERFDSSFWTDMKPDEIIELEQFTISLVNQMSSWRSLKKLRVKLDNQVYEFIQKRVLEMPSDYQTPAVLSLVGVLANMVIEAPYGAIFARAGRDFAVASSLSSLILALESPYWVKRKFDSGEFFLKK
jgi:hypothetical protein